MNDTTPEAGGGDAAELMAALAAHGGLEAMLAEQMAAVHAAAMRATKRAAECSEHPQIEALYLRQAARLMHLFVRQTEALDRRRTAAEERAERKAREAEFLEEAQHEEDERAFRLGLGPKPRRRPGRSGRRGNGTARAANGTAPPP